MPVLASITYPQGADFSLTRGYQVGWAIGWQPDAFLVTPGNPTTLEEVSFGGYRVVVGFKDWIYAYDNRQFKLGEMFEDLYAIAPGGGPPINAGGVQVQWEWDPTFNCSVIVISFDAPAPHYLWQIMPLAPSTYWNKPRIPPGIFPQWVP